MDGVGKAFLGKGGKLRYRSSEQTAFTPQGRKAVVVGEPQTL